MVWLKALVGSLLLMASVAVAQQRFFEKGIPKDAKTQHGIFTVHQFGERLYYEIPPSEFGKDFVLVTTLARTAPGGGGAGTPVNNRLVRWERRDGQVLLRSPAFDEVADESGPVAQAVHAANNDAILMAFEIEGVGSEGAPIIDVTHLFTREVPELSARRVLSATGFDASRSFIERVSAYPLNIEVEATQTYTTPAWGAAPAPRSSMPPLISGRLTQPAGSNLVHFSMMKLPEKLMQPRLRDDRIGFMSIVQADYSGDSARKRDLIHRWRLEKRDPSAAISEPIKPLVYYIDRAVPPKLVPYIKKGVEAWQLAFEGAGFRNAIIAKVAPSPQEDPNWSPDDARYSIIRWLASPIASAMGMTVCDPRTGEILKADIHFSLSVVGHLAERYFIQAGPLDPRARKLPLPDDLEGELMVNIVSHEVGHTLGLAHNMKASSTYPFDKLRDSDWLRRMGYIPSVMDYDPFNYVVQPEDNIPPELLWPQIGPYDRFAIMWSYKPVPGAGTPEAEQATLDQWLRPQTTTPWLRYTTLRSLGADPGASQDGVGDADPIRATTLGTRNLQRVIDLLVAGVPRPGEEHGELGQMYTATLEQWGRELNQVAYLVGALDPAVEEAGALHFTPVSKQKQQAAVRYLNETVFKTPRWAIRPDIVRRVEPVGCLERILNVQRSVLETLLDSLRLARLQEMEATDGETAYKPLDYFADLRSGIFSELGAANPNIDSYRRNLQRTYIAMLGELISEHPVPPELRNDTKLVHVNWDDDTRALVRGELRVIDAQIAAKIGAVTDNMTRLHLEELREHIAHLLDPHFAPPASPLKAHVPMS